MKHRWYLTIYKMLIRHVFYLLFFEVRTLFGSLSDTLSKDQFFVLYGENAALFKETLKKIENDTNIGNPINRRKSNEFFPTLEPLPALGGHVEYIKGDEEVILDDDNFMEDDDFSEEIHGINATEKLRVTWLNQYCELILTSFSAFHEFVEREVNTTKKNMPDKCDKVRLYRVPIKYGNRMYNTMILLADNLNYQYIGIVPRYRFSSAKRRIHLDTDGFSWMTIKHFKLGTFLPNDEGSGLYLDERPIHAQILSLYMSSPVNGKPRLNALIRTDMQYRIQPIVLEIDYTPILDVSDMKINVQVVGPPLYVLPLRSLNHTTKPRMLISATVKFNDVPKEQQAVISFEEDCLRVIWGPKMAYLSESKNKTNFESGRVNCLKYGTEKSQIKISHRAMAIINKNILMLPFSKIKGGYASVVITRTTKENRTKRKRTYIAPFNRPFNARNSSTLYRQRLVVTRRSAWNATLNKWFHWHIPTEYEEPITYFYIIVAVLTMFAFRNVTTLALTIRMKQIRRQGRKNIKRLARERTFLRDEQLLATAEQNMSTFVPLSHEETTIDKKKYYYLGVDVPDEITAKSMQNVLDTDKTSPSNTVFSTTTGKTTTGTGTTPTEEKDKEKDKKDKMFPSAEFSAFPEVMQQLKTGPSREPAGRTQGSNASGKANEKGVRLVGKETSTPKKGSKGSTKAPETPVIRANSKEVTGREMGRKIPSNNATKATLESAKDPAPGVPTTPAGPSSAVTPREPGSSITQTSAHGEQSASQKPADKPEQKA